MIWGIFIIESSLFFSKFLSVNMMKKICYCKANSINEATNVMVEIYSKTSENKIRTKILTEIIKEKNIFKIEVENSIYLYSKEKKNFYPSKFDKLKNCTIGKILESKPLTNEQIIENKIKFGENKMKIPIPSFSNLYKNHIITPFNIFQLFCIVLRIFDNHSSYSIISFIMILAIELILVTKRIINLVFIRNMRSPSYYIYAYRNDKWVEIPSNELLPGDIVSVIDGASIRSIKEDDSTNIKNNIIFQMIKLFKDNKKKEEEASNQRSINTILNKYKEKEKLPISCDLLLLSGTIIVNESKLTGEGMPQIKDSVTKMKNFHSMILDPKSIHKNMIINSGTKILKTERNEKSEPLPKYVKIAPPDNGAICLILKTGFNTSQGKLMRKILYEEEKIKISDENEVLLIIGLLFIISMFASFYFLIEAIKIEGELTYKLIIRCIIILTSIIPADLPFELSLITVHSLLSFESKRIICIDYSRISMAGQIDICCFDKTGTLTSGELIIKGIIYIGSSEPEIAYECQEETFTVLLGCNTLLNIDGRPNGDPIDVAMFKEVRGNFVKDEICCKRETKIKKIKEFPFSSEIKRTTVLSEVYTEKQKKVKIRVLCKGAPEIIKTLLKKVPNNYDKCYKLWAKEGYTIMALAYKDNEKLNVNDDRKQIEKDLIFCGFAIIEAPLKEKADKHISQLMKSNYDICIITGDHLLSTIKVSIDLKIGSPKFLELKIEDNRIMWNDLNNKILKETQTINEVKLLYEKYTLCVTGEEYQKLESIPNLYEITKYIKLFCRISKGQKVRIIKNLIKSGKKPLMCGDGSNDSAALSLAYIGIAMLNIKESKLQKKEPFNLFSFDNDNTLENWDAASFAPFTSKGDSIKCVKDIFIQGRYSIITKIQMYKIFIINSLLTIYTESILALKGVSFSQDQHLYFEFILSMFFLMLSKAKPLKKLNSNKPPKTILTFSSFFSIISQFLVQIISIIIIIDLTEKADPFGIENIDTFDKKFNPGLKNTIMFVFQISCQIVIFLINYPGKPFMENIWKNMYMIELIFVNIIIFCSIFFDLFHELIEYLKFVILPDDNLYKLKIIGIIIINFFCCFFLEKIKSLFWEYQPIEGEKSKENNLYYIIK